MSVQNHLRGIKPFPRKETMTSKNEDFKEDSRADEKETCRCKNFQGIEIYEPHNGGPKDVHCITCKRKFPQSERLQDTTHFQDPSEELKNHAIEFAEWMCKQGYDSKQILVNPQWCNGPVLTTRSYTSAELYDKFLTRK